MFNVCIRNAENCVSSALSSIYSGGAYLDEKVSLSKRVDYLFKTAESICHMSFLSMCVLSGVSTFLSAGYRRNLGNFSQAMLYHFVKTAPSNIYRSFLGVFYPDISDEIPEIDLQGSEQNAAKIRDKLKSNADSYIKSLLEKGDAYSKSENVLVRHLASRGTYVVTAVVSVVSRAALGALGMVAALFSFIPYFPNKSKLTLFAYKEFQFLGAVQDVFYCAFKFLNPWTKITHNGN